MLNVLSQPKPQNAETAIITIADRLDHSTMLEDRRAAALSLKALSHTNRELVASIALRGLIHSLETDKDDRDTRRALLETLIILFIKSATHDVDHAETARRTRKKNKWYMSPLALARAKQSGLQHSESSMLQVDDISLWLTDEFTQNENAMANLIEFVTSKDTFTSLYALQMLSAIFSNRPERARQAMLTISTGVSTLVSALKSDNDMLAEEAVLLLICLTDNSPDFQKLVAFEGAFEAIFDIAEEHGGVVYGGASVENCLELLTNLLTYNVSNQRLFVETQCIAKYAVMLEVSDEDMKGWSDQAVTNLQSTLHLARLFMFPGADSTTPNQNAFARGNVLLLALRLAFAPLTPLQLRVSALLAVASMVHGNNEQQQALTEIDVPYYDLSLSLKVQKQPLVLQVLQALLNWALIPASVQCFDLRVASYTLLGSVFEENLQLKTNFIAEQVAVYKSGKFSEKNANLIETIIDYDDSMLLNPYRLWFAGAILSKIFHGAHEVKDDLRKLQIGDAELGQEVITIVHAVSAQLVASLPSRESITPVSFLMLLTNWLFDDLDAVDDFLVDRSTLRSLLTYISSNQWGTSSAVVSSLATILLGVACDFSRTTSPVPRKEMYQQLRNGIGRDQYIFRVQMFRELHEFKDFDSLPLIGAPIGENGLPQVLLEPTFVSLISENINRIQRAIDHDPDMEPSARITWEMYDEVKTEAHILSQQLEQHKHDKDTEISDLQLSVDALSKQYKEAAEKVKSLTVEKAELEVKTSSLESNLASASAANTALKTSLESCQKAAESSSQLSMSSTEELQKSRTELEKLKTELNSTKEALKKAEDGINKMSRELMKLTKSQQEAEKEAAKHKTELVKVSKELETQLTARSHFHDRVQKAESDLAEERENHKIQKLANEKLIKKLEETARILEERAKEDEHLEEVLEELSIVKGVNQQLQSRSEVLEKELKLVKNKFETLKKEKANIGEKFKTALKASTLSTQSTNSSGELDVLRAQNLKNVEEILAKDDQLASAHDEIAALNAELSKLGVRGDGLTAANNEGPDGHHIVPSDNTSSICDKDQTIKSLQARIDQMQEDAAALDELLFLLDNLTEKKAKYKLQLAQLGGQVSDSDNEGGDDDTVL